MCCPTTPPKASISLPVWLKTLITAKSIRQYKIAYKQDPSQDKVKLLFKANKRLATQHTIDQYTKKGLLKALKIEKKKRTRGKRLNLIGKECSSLQFFSPTRIQAARAYQQEKEATKLAKKANKYIKKVLNKERKEKEDITKAEAWL